MKFRGGGYCNQVRTSIDIILCAHILQVLANLVKTLYRNLAYHMKLCTCDFHFDSSTFTWSGLYKTHCPTSGTSAFNTRAVSFFQYYCPGQSAFQKKKKKKKKEKKNKQWHQLNFVYRPSTLSKIANNKTLHNNNHDSKPFDKTWKGDTIGLSHLGHTTHRLFYY